jgi:hypothetical protein
LIDERAEICHREISPPTPASNAEKLIILRKVIRNAAFQLMKPSDVHGQL